jgi:hypothetical protein
MRGFGFEPPFIRRIPLIAVPRFSTGRVKVRQET